MKSGFEIKWSKIVKNDLQDVLDYLQRHWTDKEISKFL